MQASLFILYFTFCIIKRQDVLQSVFAGQNFIRLYWPYFLPEFFENQMAGSLEGLSICVPSSDSGDALLTQKIGLLSKLDHKIGPRTSTIHERNQTTEAKTSRAGTTNLVEAVLMLGQILGRNTLLLIQPNSRLINELQCMYSVKKKICLFHNVCSYLIQPDWFREWMPQFQFM